MTIWQYWFLVGLLCSIAITIYTTLVAVLQKDGTNNLGFWAKHFIAAVALAVDIGLALLVAAVAT